MAPCGFFVYGTLQRGHLRQSAWPLPPDRIEPAMVRAVLYDLGPFPALLEGDDWVAGELWHYQPNHLPRVAQALDRVEGGGPRCHLARQSMACSLVQRSENSGRRTFFRARRRKKQKYLTP
ncbi:MAG: gamma-glutamylcyclotransferase family protein [Pirellulaceae bacterium]